MRFLAKPQMSHGEILTSCISNIENTNLKDNIESNLQVFETSYQKYNEKGESGALSDFNIHNDILGIITVDNMKFLYKKMSTKGQPARVHYDKIIHSSKICPICGYRTSGTLDHYLPKTKFPIFAVNPLNLVPCCRDCNSNKLTDVPVPDMETLHPYFDNVEEYRWLFAKVDGWKNEISFNFFVEKPNSMSYELFNKVQYHFSAFQLSELYSIVATTELGDQIYLLKKLYELGGPTIVKTQLLEFYNSAQQNHLNNWKSAMYEALADSEWFCNHGVSTYGNIL